jgi:hypothetical protein
MGGSIDAAEKQGKAMGGGIDDPDRASFVDGPGIDDAAVESLRSGETSSGPGAASPRPENVRSVDRSAYRRG